MRQHAPVCLGPGPDAFQVNYEDIGEDTRKGYPYKNPLFAGTPLRVPTSGVCHSFI
jgi:hypothetical protein